MPGMNPELMAVILQHGLSADHATTLLGRTIQRYFSRHHLPPLGETSKYSPPPSDSLLVLVASLALRMVVSVSGIWGQLLSGVTQLPPVNPRCQWTVLATIGQEMNKKASSYDDF